MTYEAWRVSFQSSEQAARSAYLQVAALAEALKPFADAFQETGIQSYTGADERFAAFLDRNQITPSGEITMRQFRQAWEALHGKSALTPNA